MSTSHKSSNTQLLRSILYRRPLHPELFDLQSRRIHRQAEFEVENWVIPSGHVVRFNREGQFLTEAVIDRGDHLPETGLVNALPCIGEKDYDMEPEGQLGYVTTIQTETLAENLYMATLREMQDFAVETNSLVHQWTDAEQWPCLSVLDTQSYKYEYHAQSYHLLGVSGVVLRTQSIFELVKR